MKRKYLVLGPIVESEWFDSLEQGKPVVFEGIEMYRIGKGWKCNKKRDSHVSLALKVGTIIKQRGQLSFTGFIKIDGGRTKSAKGSVPVSGQDGIMTVE